MPVTSSPTFQFDVFLSYARNPDRQTSKYVEHFLETFHRKVPASRDLELQPLSVCRDSTDFSMPSGSAPVHDVIGEHLKKCREILVLCSSGAARSGYVDDEVRRFIDAGRPIRLALTEGNDPTCNLESKSFFPPSVIQHGLHETLCYDLRGLAGRRSRSWRSVNDANAELVRLAADIYGQPRDLLYPLFLEEDRRMWRRRVAAISAAAILILLAGVVAFWQNRVASAEERLRFAAEQTASSETARRHAEEKLKLEAERTAVSEKARRETEEKLKQAAEVNATQQEALRYAADAFERMYRIPEEAIVQASASLRKTPVPEARRALETAYRVALFRHENRRESRQLTGSSLGFVLLTARWKQGAVFASISPDGRYVLLVSERGRDGVTGDDGKPMPGSVFLLDQETLRTIRLDNCLDETEGRAEYVGFDTRTEHIFVTRHFHFQSYSLAGQCLNKFNFSAASTVSPVHIAAGYLLGKYILAADSEGRVWVAIPGSRTVQTIRGRKLGDALVDAVVAPGGASAVLVYENGRATLVDFLDGKARERPVQEANALAAAFHPSVEGVFAVSGSKGSATLYRAGAAIEPVQRFRVPGGDVDSVTWAGKDEWLVLVSADRNVHLIESTSGRLVTTLRFEADWSAARLVPNNIKPHGPGGWLEPLDPEESRKKLGDSLAVVGVDRVGGQTWLRTQRDPKDFLARGPAYLVEGETATPIPDARTNVTAIREAGGHIWLNSERGALYRMEGNRARRMLAEGTHASTIAVSAGVAWIGSQRGLWRIRDGKLERVTPDNVGIRDVVVIGNRVWIGSTRGAYVLEPDEKLYRVTESFLPVRKILQKAGRLWLLTGTESEPGPAMLVNGRFSTPVPHARSRIHDVVTARGDTWLLANDGLLRLDPRDNSATSVEGISASVSDLIDTGSAVIASAKTGMLTRALYLVDGTKARRLGSESTVMSTGRVGATMCFTEASGDLFDMSKPAALHCIEAGQARQIAGPEAGITSVSGAGGRFWLSLTDGKSAVLDNGVIKPVSIQGSLKVVRDVAGAALLLTDRGAWRFSAGRMERLTPETSVTGISEVAGKTWLVGAAGGCLLTAAGCEWLRMEHAVKRVSVIAGNEWLFTDGPAYVRDSGAGVRKIGDGSEVQDAIYAGGRTWLVAKKDGVPVLVEAQLGK